MIPLAAAITACGMIGAAILSKKGQSVRAPFLLSYALGVIFMEPWGIGGWQDLGMLVVMLLMLAISIAAGCLIGAVPALIAISAGKKLRQRSRR